MNSRATPAGSTAASTVVWCLTDGKPGHENQSRGLIAALGARRPLDVHFIAAPSVWCASRDYFGNRFPVGDGLPCPRTILAAGHSTHAAAIAARRVRGGRLVVLMRPSLPLSWFDLCLIPEHDLPQSASDDVISNVVRTRGVLNSVRPALRKDDRRGLLLIGGPSKHHDWDEQSMLQQIEAVARSDDSIGWTLTTSRRTPASLLRALQETPLENLQVMPCEKTPSGWVAAQLAAARTAFVTEDSVSMVYESLSAGADVGLLSVPRRRTSRVIRGVDRLIEQRAVIPFDDWRDHRFEHRQPVVLQEADRCAGIVSERLLNAA
ncbi:MAG: mitochondrial fission ELM1 family protein [Planctomycetaceae bacterium]